MANRWARVLRAVWINAGIALLVLVLLDGSLQLAFWLKDRGRPVAGAIPQERLRAAHPGQEWIRDYNVELVGALQERWRSYVYWRTRPFRGSYINIDEKGFRRTWNATPSPDPRAARVFMFGGSTTWGYGVRDEFTVPSLVAKKLAGSIKPAPWVVNFGEAGYVSTQELITLMLELREGNVPDVVVFYDGVNDVWAAFQSGQAGLPQNEFNRIIEFNSRDRVNWRGGFVAKLGLFRFARNLAGTVSSPADAAPRRSFLPPALGGAVIDTYLGNVRAVNALAREYGFRAVFFWQPTVFFKRTLSSDEERWGLTGGRRPGAPPFADEYRAFIGTFRQRIRSGEFSNVHDISGIFENDRRTIFVDRFHISESGNETVTDAMLPPLREIVGGVRR